MKKKNEEAVEKTKKPGSPLPMAEEDRKSLGAVCLVGPYNSKELFESDIQKLTDAGTRVTNQAPLKELPLMGAFGCMVEADSIVVNKGYKEDAFTFGLVHVAAASNKTPVPRTKVFHSQEVEAETTTTEQNLQEEHKEEIDPRMKSAEQTEQIENGAPAKEVPNLTRAKEKVRQWSKAIPAPQPEPEPEKDVGPEESSCTEETDVEDILIEAMDITTGARAEAYGPPDECMKNTAKLWSVILRREVKPAEVAACMVAVKLERQAAGPARDNWVDIAGWARLGNLCDAEKEN